MKKREIKQCNNMRERKVKIEKHEGEKVEKGKKRSIKKEGRKNWRGKKNKDGK